MASAARLKNIPSETAETIARESELKTLRQVSDWTHNAQERILFERKRLKTMMTIYAIVALLAITAAVGVAIRVIEVRTKNFEDTTASLDRHFSEQLDMAQKRLDAMDVQEQSLRAQLESLSNASLSTDRRALITSPIDAKGPANESAVSTPAAANR